MFEALLVDSDSADNVWRAWNVGLISDAEAAREWSGIEGEIAAQQRASGSASAPAPHMPQTVR